MDFADKQEAGDILLLEALSGMPDKTEVSCRVVVKRMGEASGCAKTCRIPVHVRHIYDQLGTLYFGRSRQNIEAER